MEQAVLQQCTNCGDMAPTFVCKITEGLCIFCAEEQSH